MHGPLNVKSPVVIIHVTFYTVSKHGILSTKTTTNSIRANETTKIIKVFIMHFQIMWPHLGSQLLHKTTDLGVGIPHLVQLIGSRHTEYWVKQQ